MMGKSIFIYLLILCLCFITIHGQTNHTKVTPHEDVLYELPRRVAEINEETILRVPYDPVNDLEDKASFELILKDPKFHIYRVNNIRMKYHMSVDEYDALYTKYMNTLYKLAETMNVEFKPNLINYSKLLRRVRMRVNSQQKLLEQSGTLSFLELNQQLSELDANQNLFQDRYTTYNTALIEDALMHGVVGIFDKMVNGIVGVINKYKCSWCRGLIKLLKSSTCKLAGTATCKIALNAINLILPGVGTIAGKFICGFPIYFGDVLAGWCQKAVDALLGKLGVASEKCYCTFQIKPFTIPAIRVRLLFINTPAIPVKIGYICPLPTDGTQCKKDNKGKPTGKPAPKTTTKPKPKPKPQPKRKRK